MLKFNRESFKESKNQTRGKMNTYSWNNNLKQKRNDETVIKWNRYDIVFNFREAISKSLLLNFLMRELNQGNVPFLNTYVQSKWMNKSKSLFLLLFDHCQWLAVQVNIKLFKQTWEGDFSLMKSGFRRFN